MRIVLHQILDHVAEHVVDVDAYAFAEECVVATVVDICALLVHHVVELKQAFAYAEVIFFDALLGFFDGVVDHLVLYHLVLLQAEAVEHLHHRIGCEKAHQLVFERYEEYR